MKILIVSQYYYPEQFQINEIAPELVRRGHSVTVLCGLPNYPKGEIYPGYTDESKLAETVDGVNVIRVKNKPRGHNPLSLIRNYTSFVKEANKQLENLDKDYDVVLGYQLSPVTSMLPAVKYAKETNVPLMLYVLDIWPVSAESHLPIKRGLIYKWISKVSSKIYNSADRILVTSKPFISYLNKVNSVPFEKMGYLPQHADVTMLNQDLAKSKESVVNFMFAGNLGSGATLEVIVNAAKIIGKRPDYKVHFIGDGSQRLKLENLIKSSGLSDNFVFHGNKSRNEMPDYYKLADALLITLRGNNEVGNTMPGKLQMYMTVGKPIFGAINGAAKEVIEEAQCGKCTKAGDSEGLADIMLDFIENSTSYAQCGENARKYFVNNFTLDKYVSCLETELSKLIKR